jgi:ABC-type amino acid transport substrate-binding protein
MSAWTPGFATAAHRCLAIGAFFAALYPVIISAKITDVHVVGDRSFYPYEYCGSVGAAAHGILVEQWRSVGRKSGLRIHYTCDDWDAAQKTVISGKADAIGGMIMSPDRQTRFRFIRQLVRNPPEYVYWDANGYTTEPELRMLVRQGVDVAVTRGDYAVEWLTANLPGIKLRPYDSYVEVVRAAATGHIHVFVMEESVAAHHLDQLGISQRFSRSSSALFSEWLWATVRKDDDALATRLAEAFAGISDDELRRIAETWSPPRSLWWSETQNRFRTAIENNPVYTVVSAVIILYVLGLIVLYLVHPASVYALSGWLRGLQETVTVKLGAVELKLPLRAILLIASVDTSARVLDAFLRLHRDTIVTNVLGRKTFKDRQSHFVLPLVVDGQRVESGGVQERRRQLAAHLRKTFHQRAPCVTIIAEGGAGKTSLACLVAREALQISADALEANGPVFPQFTIPVMIESQLAQDLLDAIHGQLNALAQQQFPNDVLVALLKLGRIVVIIDGLSEMNDAARGQVIKLDPRVPRFAAVVTSRREEPVFGGIATVEIRPFKLSGPPLAAFLEFCLAERGIRDQFTDTVFFRSCEALAQLVGGAEISPLLVVLFAHLLAPDETGSGRAHALRGISDLFFEYVNRLNAAVKEGRKSDTDVHRALRALAWACVSSTYQPQSCSREEALKAVNADAPTAEAMLRYLEERLSLIETVWPAQTHVTFGLDPVAESFAASHIVQDLVSVEHEWERFVAFVSAPGHLPICLGFARAVVAAAHTTDPSSLPAARRAAINELDAAVRSLDALAS